MPDHRAGKQVAEGGGRAPLTFLRPGLTDREGRPRAAAVNIIAPSAYTTYNKRSIPEPSADLTHDVVRRHFGSFADLRVFDRRPHGVQRQLAHRRGKLQNIVCEGGPLRECGRKRHAQRKLMVNKGFALTGSGADPCDNCDGDRSPFLR